MSWNSFRFEMARLRVRQVRRRHPRVSKSRARRMAVRSSKGRVSRLLEVGGYCREGIGRKGKGRVR
jgi:hypothetical protein